MITRQNILPPITIALALVLCVAAGADPSAVTLEGLPPNAQKWVDRALGMYDATWDEAAGMPGQGSSHSTRGAMIYATGLLLRNGPGAVARAHRAMEHVLALQYDAPGKSWHGTYRRNEREKDPADSGAMAWRSYDPNWREFVGVMQILAIESCGDLLRDDLREKLDAALRRACEGAHERDVRPEYSNIAIMSAYLLSWGGRAFKNSEWAAHGRDIAEAVFERFEEHGAFAEFNSPTYYGTDFFGLAFWRALPITEEMARMGRKMEAELWRDVARFYHAGLGNLCGPYDRSYGMDMHKYCAKLGLCIALVTDSDKGMPGLAENPSHTHDLGFMPLMGALQMAAPEEVIPQLRHFAGPRRIERVIEDGRRTRTAYAWIEEGFMAGAAHVVGRGYVSSQFHPFTLHWRCPNGEIGWIRLRHPTPITPRIDGDTIVFERVNPWPTSKDQSIVFEGYAPGATAQFAEDRWNLSGMTIGVETALPPPSTIITGGKIELRFNPGKTMPTGVRISLRPERGDSPPAPPAD